MLSTVTETIELVTDNIDIKKSKRYFRIKKGHLYWYNKEDSDKAQNDLDIRKIKQMEINQDNDRMILIEYDDKIYKLEHKNKKYIQEWYKSLCLVRSKSEEYLNLDRYINTKVFERTTGKSLFRDFEEILRENSNKIEEQKRKAEEEVKRIRDAEIEKELKLEIENNKKEKVKPDNKKEKIKPNNKKKTGSAEDSEEFKNKRESGGKGKSKKKKKNGNKKGKEKPVRLDKWRKESVDVPPTRITMVRFLETTLVLNFLSIIVNNSNIYRIILI